jgi:hypothetical protein
MAWGSLLLFPEIIFCARRSKCLMAKYETDHCYYKCSVFKDERYSTFKMANGVVGIRHSVLIDSSLLAW